MKDRMPKKYTCYGFITNPRQLMKSAVIWQTLRTVRLVRNRQTRDAGPVEAGCLNLAALPPEIFTYIEDWIIAGTAETSETQWPFTWSCHCLLLERVWREAAGRKVLYSILLQLKIETSLLEERYEAGTNFCDTTHPAVSRLRKLLVGHPQFLKYVETSIQEEDECEHCDDTKMNLWETLLRWTTMETKQVRRMTRPAPRNSYLYYDVHRSAMLSAL